jgi:DNA-binding response OmpR family regulator
MLQLADLLDGLLKGHCLNCLRPHLRLVDYGPLMVKGNRVHWKGIKQPDFTVTEGRLLALLVQFKEVSHHALQIVLPGNGGDNCLKVHMRNIRRKLLAIAPGEVEIRHIRGLGYSINLKEHDHVKRQEAQAGQAAA